MHKNKNSENLWSHCGQSLSHAILTKLHTILHIFKHKSLYDKTKNKLVLIKILTTKISQSLCIAKEKVRLYFGMSVETNLTDQAVPSRNLNQNGL